MAALIELEREWFATYGTFGLADVERRAETPEEIERQRLARRLWNIFNEALGSGEEAQRRCKEAFGEWENPFEHD